MSTTPRGRSSTISRAEFDLFSVSVSENFSKMERAIARIESKLDNKGTDWKAVWSAMGVISAIVMFLLTTIGGLVSFGLNNRIDDIRDGVRKADVELENRAASLADLKASQEYIKDALRSYHPNSQRVLSLVEEVKGMREKIDDGDMEFSIWRDRFDEKVESLREAIAENNPGP